MVCFLIIVFDLWCLSFWCWLLVYYAVWFCLPTALRFRRLIVGGNGFEVFVTIGLSLIELLTDVDLRISACCF